MICVSCTSHIRQSRQIKVEALVVESQAVRQTLTDNDSAASETLSKRERSEVGESEDDWQSSEAAMEVPVISPLRAYGTSIFILDSESSDSDRDDDEDEDQEQDQERNAPISNGTISIDNDLSRYMDSSDNLGQRIGSNGRKFDPVVEYDSSECEASGFNEGKGSCSGDNSSDDDEASYGSRVKRKLKIYDDSSSEGDARDGPEGDQLDNRRRKIEGSSISERDNNPDVDDLDAFHCRNEDVSEDCNSIDGHCEMESERDNTRSEGSHSFRRGSGSKRIDPAHDFVEDEGREGHSQTSEENQREGSRSGSGSGFRCRRGCSVDLKVEVCDGAAEWEGAPGTDRSSGRFTDGVSDVTYGGESVLALAVTASAVAAYRAVDSKAQCEKPQEDYRGDNMTEGRVISEIECDRDDYPVSASPAVDYVERARRDMLLLSPSSAFTYGSVCSHLGSPEVAQMETIEQLAPTTPTHMAKDDSASASASAGARVTEDGSGLLISSTCDNNMVGKVDSDVMVGPAAPYLSAPLVLLPLATALSTHTPEGSPGKLLVGVLSGDISCRDWIEKVIGAGPKSRSDRRASDPNVAESSTGGVDLATAVNVEVGTETTPMVVLGEVAHSAPDIEAAILVLDAELMTAADAESAGGPQEEKCIATEERITSNISGAAISSPEPFVVNATVLQYTAESAGTVEEATSSTEAGMSARPLSESQRDAVNDLNNYPSVHTVIAFFPSSSGEGMGLEKHTESAENLGSEVLEVLQVVEVTDLPLDQELYPVKAFLVDESKEKLSIIIEDTGYRIGSSWSLNPPSASFNPSSCNSKMQSPFSTSKILSSNSGDVFSSTLRGRVPGFVIEIDPAEEDITADPCAEERDFLNQQVPCQSPEAPPPPPPAEMSESPTALSCRDPSAGAFRFRSSEGSSKVEQSTSTMPSYSCEGRSMSPGISMVR